MTRYKEKLSQEERILKLLRERGKAGVYVWEFMLPRNQGGMGVVQYNARIWGLKQKGFNIINVKPGHFVLEEYKEVEIEKGGSTVSQLAFV